MNKATSWEDKYSEIEKAYRYAEEVATFVGNLCLGLQCRNRKGREFVEIQDIINEIKSREEELSRITDFEILNRIFPPSQECNPERVLTACRKTNSLIIELVQLSENEIKLYPIEGLDIEVFDEGKTWLNYKGKCFKGKERYIVGLYYEVLRLLEKDKLKRQQSAELEVVYRSLPGILAYQNSSTANKPKRGRRSKADLKSRSNRELLIAILLKHHRYESKNGLNLDPISTEEARKQLGKSVATLSKTWKEIQPTLTYANYAKLCGRYESLEKLLKAIDSKEGYLERSNKEEAIDNSEG